MTHIQRTAGEMAMILTALAPRVPNGAEEYACGLAPKEATPVAGLLCTRLRHPAGPHVHHDPDSHIATHSWGED